MAELISSAANPLVNRMRQLACRKHRRRQSAFVVQGIQSVNLCKGDLRVPVLVENEVRSRRCTRLCTPAVRPVEPKMAVGRRAFLRILRMAR